MGLRQLVLGRRGAGNWGMMFREGKLAVLMGNCLVRSLKILEKISKGVFIRRLRRENPGIGREVFHRLEKAVLQKAGQDHLLLCILNSDHNKSKLISS